MKSSNKVPKQIEFRNELPKTNVAGSTLLEQILGTQYSTTTLHRTLSDLTPLLDDPARHGRIVRSEPRQQHAHDLGAGALLGDTEEGPGAFTEALDQAGFAQELQVARDARLRLAQNLGKVGNGEFGLSQQRQNAQPGAFPGGLQGGIQSGESQIGPLRHYTLTSGGSRAYLKNI